MPKCVVVVGRGIRTYNLEIPFGGLARELSTSPASGAGLDGDFGAGFRMGIRLCG